MPPDQSLPEGVYKSAWEAGDSAVDWEVIPAKDRRAFKRQINAAAPFVAAKAVEKERARRRPAWADVPPTKFSAWGQEQHDRAEKAERERDQAIEARREIESKLESGYAFCHPEEDCEGKRAWLKACGERDQAVQQERERERWEGWFLSMLEFSLYLRTLRNPPSMPRLVGSIKRALQGKDAPKLGAHLGADAERQVRAALDDQEGDGDGD